MPTTGIAQTEHFEGNDLAGDRWVPWYLPHWSSRESSRATYDVASSVLRLSVPTAQGLWCGDRHSPALRTSTIASGLSAGPLGSTVGQQPFADGLTPGSTSSGTPRCARTSRSPRSTSTSASGTTTPSRCRPTAARGRSTGSRCAPPPPTFEVDSIVHEVP